MINMSNDGDITDSVICYLPTSKGKEVYQNLVEQLEAYVMHFDVFAYVDLEEGIFGDPKTDLLEGDHWSDLRVAYTCYKRGLI